MDRSFFQQDVRTVAEAMIGMKILRTHPDGHKSSFVITETEAYCGAEDSACYAFKGRNKTSELLFHDGGTIFVHRCYGIHLMLNIVTVHEDDPQGVLIRGIDEIHGPEGSSVIPCQATPRIGIAYASKEDQEKPLRFVAVHEGTE